MEGLLTNYYEYHLLYISGIHYFESRNVQGMALMKLQFHPGTNMAQAMADTINYVNRSRAFTPPRHRVAVRDAVRHRQRPRGYFFRCRKRSSQVAAGPFLLALVDMVSLRVYFTIASWIVA